MNQCHIAIYKQTTLPGLCLSVPPLDFFFFLLMSCTTLYQHLIKEKKKLNWRGVPVPKIFIYTYTHTLFLKNDLSILWSVHFSRHSKMQIGYLMITCESTRSMQSFAPSPPPTSVAIIIFLSQKIPKQTKLPVYFAVRFLWCCRSASVDRFFSFFFLFLSYKKSFVSLWHLLKSRENCLTLCRANNVGL